jgi:long-subunit fatty acid transport protein
MVLCCLLVAGPARAAQYAGAFLETGAGPRAAGMGGAFSALADDASAPFWNPAGLVRSQGQGLLASLQPLSLDRRQASLAYALNVRGELAFGLAWQHVRAGELVARAGDGAPLGGIEDGENAYQVAVARALGKRAALGLGLKVLRHAIDTPQTGRSTGRGSGFDLGVQVYLRRDLALAATLRDLKGSLDWKVNRASSQTSNTSDELSADLGLGLAYRPWAALVLAAEGHRAEAASYLSLGGEWQVSPLLTLRAGLGRIGGGAAPAFGLSLRPMRRDHLQFHYAYTADALGAGNRVNAGLGLRF